MNTHTKTIIEKIAKRASEIRPDPMDGGAPRKELLKFIETTISPGSILIFGYSDDLVAAKEVGGFYLGEVNCFDAEHYPVRLGGSLMYATYSENGIWRFKPGQRTKATLIYSPEIANSSGLRTEFWILGKGL